MENTGSTEIKLGEILYWLFFGSLLFAKGIGLYDGQLVFKLVLIFAFGCLALKLAIESYTITEILGIIFIIALTGMTYVISGEKGMLLNGLMVIGMKNVSIKRIFTVGAMLWTAAFLGVTIFSLFHMEDTVYKVHSKLGMGHIFRWSLGYPHPNVLQVSYIILAIFVIYLLGDAFKLKHAFWLFAGNCLVFLYSVSYTGFIVFMCLLLGRIYLLFRKRLCFAEKLLLQMIFPGCVFISLLAPVKLSGRWFRVLDNLLSHRLELAWWYLEPEYMSLWGRRLSEITTEAKTMDNAYLFAFITYGAIPFTILCFATMYMIYRYLKRNAYLETLIILSIAVGGLTEPFLYNTSFKNLSFLFMGALLFEHRKERKEWGLQSLGLNLSGTWWNRQFTIRTGTIAAGKNRICQILKADWKKCIAACLIALIIGFLVNRMVTYPEGYVVYRVDCSDLTKERHYYREDASEYQNFKRMHSFEEGDEIEYYDGNIVIMEKIRNEVMGMAIGGLCGYVIMGTWISMQSRKYDKAKIEAVENLNG